MANGGAIVYMTADYNSNEFTTVSSYNIALNNFMAATIARESSPLQFRFLTW